MKSPFLLGALVLGLCACSPPTANPVDAGCQPPAAPKPDAAVGCHLAFIGDPSKDIELELIVMGADNKSAPVADGGAVALIEPPQGGRIIFVGARAKNIDPCGVTLLGYLRDETTKQVRLDKRTINLEPGCDGWGRSLDEEISTFSNVPACANEWSKTNIYGTEYELGVSITDRKTRTATRSVRVVPACTGADLADDAGAVSAADVIASCQCICRGGYKLGDPCDGGVEAGP